MTRQEKMIDLIQMYSYFAQFSNDKSKCHCEALQMAIEALEENKSLAKSLNDAAELIHKLQKNEWIPCSERMPKHDTKVLVQTEHGLITDGRLSSELNIWFTMDDYTCYKVVAWMPLPSPYKEDES